MDVDTFIRRHGADWERLAALTEGGHRALARRGGAAVEEALGLYHRASAHLAEAQTRLRDPDLVAHLTGVVGRARAAVHGARPATRQDVLAVFGRRYARAVGQALPAVWVAAAVLFGSMLLVAAWTAASPEARAGLVPGFAASVAGDRLADLRSADPALGLMIFVNNVRVAVFAFVAGITLGVGTVWLLAANGVLIGALAGAASALGIGDRFLALVLPHGFLELLAICLAGGAGLHMGWAVVRPGDRPRRVALAREARTALLVVIGVVPAFLVAAAVEGLLTGVTGLPLLEVGIGLALAVAYAVWLVRVGRAGGEVTAAPRP